MQANEVLNQEQIITPIYKLPDELLDQIFVYLDIKERLRTELVCKRWRMVGKHLPWSYPNCLVFDPHERHIDSTKGKWCLTDQSLKALLSRCGLNVKQLVLVKCSHPKYNPKYSVTVSAEAISIIGLYCRKLRKITLEGLKLNQESLQNLARCCGQLKEVHFKNFGYFPEGFESFYELCRDLESLKLEHNCYDVSMLELALPSISVSRRGFRGVAPNLRVLNLIGCDNFNNIILQNVRVRCHSLEELRLAVYCPKLVKSDLLLSVLKYLRQMLKVLDLFFPAPFNWCSALENLPKLEELHLHAKPMILQCPCSAKKACFYGVSPNLKILNVSSNFLFHTGCDVEYLLKQFFLQCEYLQELSLEDCYLSRSTMVLALKFVSAFRVLDFTCCKILDQFDWCHFLALFINLEKLRLNFCNDINDEVMASIAGECVKLQVLHLCSCDITDDGLVCLANLPDLNVLDVSDCGGITGSGLKVLARKGTLEELYIATCTDKLANVTDDDCATIALCCPNFHHLDVSNALGRSNITNRLVITFVKSVQEGFRKNTVELVVGGTAVTEDVSTCDQIEVIFNFYHHPFFSDSNVNSRMQGRLASFSTF